MTKRNKKECTKCKRNISLSNYKRHINSCTGKINKPNIIVNENWFDEKTGKYSCPYCNKKYSKKGISSHIILSHLEEGKEWKSNLDNFNRTRDPWNKNLTKETDERVKINTENSAKSLNILRKEGKVKPPVFSEEFLKRQSEKMSLHNPGGKCKWYTVDGVKVQGTWERDIAKTFTRKNIKWIKPSTSSHSFKYNMDDKIKTYTPDFYLEELELYIEVKGYWWGRDKEKMNAVKEQYPSINLLIIEKENYKKFLYNVDILDGELVW